MINQQLCINAFNKAREGLAAIHGEDKYAIVTLENGALKIEVLKQLSDIHD